MRKIVSIVLIFALVLGLSACSKSDSNENNSQVTKVPNTTDSPKTTDGPQTTTEAVKPTESDNSETKEDTTHEPTAISEPAVSWDGSYMNKEDFLAYTAHDLETVFEAIEDQLEDAEYSAVKAIVNDGISAINASDTVSEAENAYKAAFNGIINAIPLADGTYSYKKESNAERTNILGILEQYAIANGMAGISLFEDGSYNMYSDRITLGTENYIISYGFGIFPEGSINSDLDYETNDAWKRYYHTVNTSDPGTLNALNDQGMVLMDYNSYFSAAFLTKFMNATKDGYEWVPELAKEKPQPVNDDDGDGMCTTWRMEVRTGDDGLKYKTGSEMESRKAFDGRPVELEDYETIFKFLLTQANQQFRGSELANDPSDIAIVGAKDYYDATADDYDDDLWEDVGIKTYVEDGRNYFEYTFVGEQTKFYAMYYISQTFYSPIPQDFIDLVTEKNFMGFNEDGTETPVDNCLALGPYYVERYDSEQQIVFAKNPYYVYADTKYSVPGIHVKIFPAAKSDTTAIIKEFLAGHIDACVIPQEYLNDYKNDPRTRITLGNSNDKLNLNACDEKTWKYLFGENGTVVQNSKEDYWNVKPVLGNAHFRKALGLSINRKALADARGRNASIDYFSSNYMSDPDLGISYNNTDAHKKAVAQLLEDADGYGYSLELAREYFRMAITELENEGYYKPGTKENPTEIVLETAWREPDDEEVIFKELKNYIENAFNDDSVTGGLYKLTVTFWVGNSWTDVYYNKMLIGQYDIGNGAIMGNELDPMAFLSVLSSDPTISSNFTLCWGVDTNNPDVYPLVYDGKRWSFDALFSAANGQAIVKAGKNQAE